VSSVPEVEWDDDQRALVEAEAIVRANTGHLGEWLPDATSEEADPNSYSGFRFVASSEKTNWAVKAERDRIDEIRKAKGDDANMNGVFVSVECVDYRTS
jgi:hypothetical protein